MTVHFELMLACDLVENVPQQVVDILKCIAGQVDYSRDLPQHPFFYNNSNGENRVFWKDIFKFEEYGPDLSYFAGTAFILFQPASWDKNIHKFTVHYEGETHHDFAEAYYPFLQWLAPYIDHDNGSFSGYFNRFNQIYSKSENPALIYFEDDKVYFAEVQGKKIEINAETVWDFL